MHPTHWLISTQHFTAQAQHVAIVDRSTAARCGHVLARRGLYAAEPVGHNPNTHARAAEEQPLRAVSLHAPRHLARFVVVRARAQIVDLVALRAAVLHQDVLESFAEAVRAGDQRRFCLLGHASDVQSCPSSAGVPVLGKTRQVSRAPDPAKC